MKLLKVGQVKVSILFQFKDSKHNFYDYIEAIYKVCHASREKGKLQNCIEKILLKMGRMK